VGRLGPREQEKKDPAKMLRTSTRKKKNEGDKGEIKNIAKKITHPERRHDPSKGGLI